MHPLLARTLHAIEAQVEGMAPEALERHPPGKWSAANILEHLAITYDGTRRNFQKCLDTGQRRATHATLRQRLGVLVIIEMGRFPDGTRAPAPTVPTGLPAAAALRAVRDNLQALDRAMLECEATFGARRPIADHPLFGPLSLRQWRRFHWIHAQHHMRQIASRQRG